MKVIYHILQIAGLHPGKMKCAGDCRPPTYSGTCRMFHIICLQKKQPSCAMSLGSKVRVSEGKGSSEVYRLSVEFSDPCSFPRGPDDTLLRSFVNFSGSCDCCDLGNRMWVPSMRNHSYVKKTREDYALKYIARRARARGTA